MPDPRPLGVFDSGVGGLSVLREIARRLPHEDLVYFADSAHCPYGPRLPEEIRRLSESAARFLLDHGAKTVVVACNTASAAALAHLRRIFDVPIVGMVPAVKPASAETRSGVVGVLATEATVQGQLFAEVVERFALGVTVVTQVCPGLVDAVEGGQIDGAETEALLRRYVEPLLAQGADTLVLGCTHYPFLAPAIRRIAGPAMAILDPSPAVARQTARVLTERDLLNAQPGPGRREYYTSGDPAQFAVVRQRLLGDRSLETIGGWES